MRDRPNPLAPRRAVVMERVRETADIVSLTVALPDGGAFEFGPGQFDMLGRPGWGEAPFSFSSPPLEGGRFVHTIRIAGNVTRAICGLEPGEWLHLRGPYGRGWPLDRARGKNIVIVGGGIGIAPLRPALRAILERRAEFGEVFAVFGARTEKDLPFRAELEGLAAEPSSGVRLTVDRREEGAGGLIREGLVTALLDGVPFPAEGSLAFSCGPELMMRFVARDLLRRGQRPGDHYVSLERRMECGLAHCGHCQVGAKYVCMDGPVFAYGDIARFADVVL